MGRRTPAELGVRSKQFEAETPNLGSAPSQRERKSVFPAAPKRETVSSKWRQPMPERHAKPQAIRPGAGFRAQSPAPPHRQMEIFSPLALAQLTEAEF